MLKAFVICNDIVTNADNPNQKDLKGAGLSTIDTADRFPAKSTFWVYVQIADQRATRKVRLAVMRADSGRRLFFRPITLRHDDLARPAILCVRLFECIFPERGVYFIELWYDDEWLVDQRLELK